MKYFMMIIIAVLFTVASHAEAKKLGKEITLKKTTKISQILEKPESYVGKKVLIEGTIVDVCKKRGCWIEVSGDKEFQKIKVKVDDGVIVFPASSKGQKVTVEGEVEKIVAESHVNDGKTHDENKKSCNHGDKTYYRLKGLGAVIAD